MTEVGQLSGQKKLFNKYVGTTRYLYLEKEIQLDPNCKHIEYLRMKTFIVSG